MPLTTHLVYFENAVGRLSEHAQGYAIVRYHPGKRQAQDFQAFLTHLDQLLRRRGWHKVLTDQRELSPFTEAERKLLGEQWLHPPGGLRPTLMVAILLPQEVFARLASQQLMHEARQSAVVYHLFDEETAAGHWLRQAP